MSEVNCLIILDDPIHDHHHHGEFYNKLRIKFRNQSKGTFLWHSNRLEIKHYIPIEYAKDKLYIDQFLNKWCHRVGFGKDHPWENILPSLLESDFPLCYKLFGVCGVKLDRECPEQLINLFRIHGREFALENVKRDGMKLREMLDYQSDKEIVLEAIKQNPKSHKFIGGELMRDRMFVLDMVKVNGMVFPHLEKKYLSDRQIALSAISNSPSVFQYLNEKLSRDREFILDAIRENGRVLDFGILSSIKDRELVLLALYQICEFETMFLNSPTDLKQVALSCVKRDACSIVLRLEECCNDVDIVVESLKQTGNCEVENDLSAAGLLNKLFDLIDSISNQMKNNKQVITELLSQVLNMVVSVSKKRSNNSGLTATVFSHVNNLVDETNVKEDKDIVLLLLQIIGSLLDSGSSECNVKHVINRFWNRKWESDIEYMLKVVECHYHFFLQLVTEDLRENKPFMIQVLKFHPQAFVYCSIFLRNNKSFMLHIMREYSINVFQCETLLVEDRQFAMEAVSLNGMYLEYLPDFDNDREVVFRAVRTDGNSLIFASEYLCEDRELVLEAVRNCGLSLGYASYELQQDREVILEAVRNDSSTIELFDECLHDRQIVLEAVKGNYFSIPYESKKYFKNDKEFLLECVKQTIEPLIHASNSMKNDREIILTAIRTDPSAIRYASVTLKDDKEIALMVVKAQGCLLEFLSENMKKDRQVVLEAIRNSADSFRHARGGLTKDKEIILEAIRNGLDVSFFIHDRSKVDLDMIVEALKRDECGTCAILKRLLHDEDGKVEIAQQSGFCCRFEENLFQERIDYAYFGATLQNCLLSQEK